MKPNHESGAPWRSGLEGARAHLGPGLALQAAALVLVVAYYRWPPAQAALSHLMAAKLRIGFLFGVASTALFGGLLPFFYLRSGPHPYGWRQGAGLTAFWAYKGFEIDLLYRTLARFVGTGHGAGTIAAKVFIDQFVYCPLFAIPVTVLVYGWVDLDFDTRALVADTRRPGWYLRRVLPVLISNMGVWIPTVAIVYSLPTPLQLPLQNLVLCFYTLLVAHQTRSRPEAAKPALAAAPL